MNWTGGSLQRHSKSNVDALVKKQKQHFAKARLQSQSQYFRPSSSSHSVLDDLIRESIPKIPRFPRPIPRSLAEADVSDRQYKTSPGVRRTVELEHSPALERRLSHQAGNDEADRQGNHGIMCHSIANPVNRQPENVNGVDYARKDLLQKSDWVGLATMRPARFKQSVRDEVDKVGRRRNATSLKRKRTTPQTGAGRNTHRTIRPAKHAPSLQTEDISVRVGSNIHRTQTTPSIFARKDSTQPPGRATLDSILVKRVDNEPRTRGEGPKTPDNPSSRFQEQTFVARNESLTELAPVIAARLVPLDEAVDLRLSSWDMVRDHSANDTTSSTPILPSDPSFLLPLEGDVGADPGFAASQENKEATALSFPHEYPPRQPSTPTLPNIIQRGVAVGVVEVAASEASPPQFYHRDLYQRSLSGGQITTPLAGSAQASKQRFHKFLVPSQIGTSPRFTLDAQIELERTVAGLERKADLSGISALINPSDSLTKPLNAAPSSSGFNTSEVGARSGLVPQNVSSISPSNKARPQILRDNLEPGGGRGPPPSHPRAFTKHSSIVPGPTHDRNEEYSHTTSAADNTALASASNVLDNEAWIKFVFPDGHREVQGGIQFTPNHVQLELDRARHLAPSSTDELFSANDSKSGFQIHQRHHDSVSENFESTGSIRTGANTSLFIPRSQNREPTETDFLSHFSPMEGYLDERLVDVSVYNNAARIDSRRTASGTESQISGQPVNDYAKSMPRPLVPAKRNASHLLATETARLRPRHIHDPATFSQPVSQRFFGSTTRATQGDMNTAYRGRVPAIGARNRPAALHNTPRYSTARTPGREYRAGGSQELDPVTEREQSPASIFITSDKPMVGASLSSSTGMAAPSIDDDTRTTSFRLSSAVSHNSLWLSDPSPGSVLGPAFFSPRTTPDAMGARSTMVNIHTLPPSNFTLANPQFPAQILLWGKD